MLIDAKKAKEIMDSDKKAIVLDVRTEEEYELSHIENSVLIPDYELAEKCGKMLPDKDAVILVCCRTGARSRQSANLLTKLGYTKIYDFGGLVDWPYELVDY